jgi:translation initiation factor 1A
MPQNNKKKSKQKGGKQVAISSSRALVVAEDEQTYGIILKALGDRHFTVLCQDSGHERRCRVRGKMLNRQFVREGDVVLVSLQDFNEGKNGDIIEVYSPDQIRTLRKDGEFTMRSGEQPDQEKEDDLADQTFDFENI